MRRRAFLDQSTIDASRDVVCVRLNAWQDQLNVDRIVTLQGAHQNSSLALLAPDAPGVAKDSFPRGEACAWGPLDFNAGDPDRPWDELGTRLQWLPHAMGKLARQYPVKASAADTPAVLPVFPDLTQVLNIGACDCEAVIVEVAQEADVPALDAALNALIHEPAIIGRAHLVRVSPKDWRQAILDGQIVVDRSVDWRGVFVVEPDPYGQRGKVLAQAPGLPAIDDIRNALHRGLQTFAQEFRKKDRSTHIIEGRVKGVRWKEAKADGWRQYLEQPSDAPPPADCEVSEQ